MSTHDNTQDAQHLSQLLDKPLDVKLELGKHPMRLARLLAHEIMEDAPLEKAGERSRPGGKPGGACASAKRKFPAARRGAAPYRQRGRRDLFAGELPGHARTARFR